MRSGFSVWISVLAGGCIWLSLTVAALPAAWAEGLFTYQPPLRGAPVNRVGAGIRGVNTDDLALCLLAAPEPALTLKAQPAIYWYADGDGPVPLRFELHDPRSGQPLLTLALTTPPAGAVQPIRLQDHGITLDTDVDYRLTLTRTDTAPPLQAVATLRRVYTPAILADVPSQPLHQQASRYAAAGIWYDAFAALSQLITDNTHDNAVWHRQRAALLEQVELPRAAAYERAVAGG